MKFLLDKVRALLARLAVADCPPDPLDGLTPGQLADLPPFHPERSGTRC